jgi:hypothetical protein
MSQAYNLGKFANTLNSSGQIDVTTGITGTFPTTNLPTIPINKGGTNLTTVGANGTILSTDGSAYIYGSASGALTWDTVKTSSFTAVAGYGYLVNTTSSTITVTLPASPSIGQSVVVVDYAGTAATNNITVDPNGSKINTGGAKLIQTNRTGLTFVYIDATQGWLAQSNVYSGNPPFVPAPINISYLVVAGGGGGGIGVQDWQCGGGGGAGGYLASTASLTSGAVYTTTVGGGGAGNTSGSNSVLSGTGVSVTSIGGGNGGSLGGGSTVVASNGGSGGGAGKGTGGAGTAGTGTSGQGNNGGLNQTGGNNGGGGGGATSAGSNGIYLPNQQGGAGGGGTASSITGSSVTYAGGGGGGGDKAYGAGGSGGGGNGGASTIGPSPSAAVSGTTNLGGGGGGGTSQNPYTGAGSGGSGVVILSIPTAQYTGTSTGSPTITTSGSNTILKFTASGTYTA